MRSRLVVVIGAIALLAALTLALWALVVLRAPRPALNAPPRAPIGRPAPAGPIRAHVDFIDTFNEIDARRWGVSERAATGDWMENDWREALAATGPEGLVLTMTRSREGSQSPLSSGEIYSRDTHRYGYYEVRMRAPRGEGEITGAFTYADASEHAPSQEIDIEIIGRDTRSVALSYHVAGRSTGKVVRLPFDAADRFHTYAFEWGPGVIRYYVDGALAHEAHESALQRMTKPQRIILNLWGTAMLYRWAGRIEPANAPWRLTFACVARADRYPGHMLCPVNRPSQR